MFLANPGHHLFKLPTLLGAISGPQASGGDTVEMRTAATEQFRTVEQALTPS